MKLTPEDAESVLKRMRDCALLPLDSNDMPIEVTDEQYEAVKEALMPAIADVIEKHIGVGI